MKNFYLLVLSFTFSVFFGQTEYDKDMEDLVNTEGLKYQKMLATTRNVNPNTLNYDLRYQRLELTLDPATSGNVSGVVTSHFIPNQDMNSIYFDFNDGFTVSSVKYKGNNVTFTKLTTNEIKIDFPTTLVKDVLDSLSISYSGTPVNENMITTYSRHRQAKSTNTTVPYVIYTLSEPYGARDWFPTKQSMNDKIEKVRVEVTTPTGIYVASNGKLISETAISGTQLKTIWQTEYPIPAYLIAIGVTNYNKYTDTIGNPPFPFLNYIYPMSDTTANRTALITNTKPIMDLFETYFGPYPYRNEKYGHMQFDFSGGMEHATMTSMGTGSLSSLSIIAHELGHQWFGDKTTCKNWNDIWINEGFARFTEHLYNEKITNKNNKAAFINYLQTIINAITASPGGSVYVSDSGLEVFGELFGSRLSYNKGSYLLRMLKWMVGDDTFYQAVRNYSNQYAYNYATGMDFKASFEASTGKNFTEFFNDWYFGEGYPIYDIRWKQNANQSISFKASQTKSITTGPAFFEMLLPIKVTGTGGQTAEFALNNTSNGQTFTLPLGFDVASVSFNYENQILTTGSTVTNDTTFLTTGTVTETPIKLYPNPATNEIGFAGLKKALPFEIYSLDGKLVKKGKFEPNKTVDISGFSSGGYVIRVNDQKYHFIKK
ncbi:peptidase M1 [Cloacibacterium rupense]|uniref:Aminopeptidase N n=1 Tax=Cloacibacterium rupense TaxID=517423 RepID=A0ABQ2NP81_9FLAO|nr:M1 family aminopeptidase [Cloacibacterium rupense]GGP06583.1 peptidase M1 [Cloacibacterium rupense]